MTCVVHEAEGDPRNLEGELAGIDQALRLRQSQRRSEIPADAMLASSMDRPMRLAVPRAVFVIDTPYVLSIRTLLDSLDCSLFPVHPNPETGAAGLG
jgi:broad specificity phosphatase PhoE